MTRIPFESSQAKRWSKLPVKSSIVDEVEIARQQLLSYVPGSWILRHLVSYAPQKMSEGTEIDS